MLKDFTIANMLDMSQTIAGELFEGKTYPWEVLPEIGDFIVKLGKTLDPDEYDCVEENVWIAKTAKVAPTAFINGPAIIGKNTEVTVHLSAEMPLWEKAAWWETLQSLRM